LIPKKNQQKQKAPRPGKKQAGPLRSKEIDRRDEHAQACIKKSTKTTPCPVQGSSRHQAASTHPLDVIVLTGPKPGTSNKKKETQGEAVIV